MDIYQSFIGLWNKVGDYECLNILEERMSVGNNRAWKKK